MPTIYLDKGPAYGVGFIVSAAHPRVAGYLQAFTGQSTTVSETLSVVHAKVGILETIRIPDESRRGAGYGKWILAEFMARCRAEEVSVILLIADVEEDQCAGFDLAAWYQRQGFSEVLPTAHGPLYAYPKEAAAALATALLQLA